MIKQAYLCSIIAVFFLAGCGKSIPATHRPITPGYILFGGPQPGGGLADPSGTTVQPQVGAISQVVPLAVSVSPPELILPNGDSWASLSAWDQQAVRHSLERVPAFARFFPPFNSQTQSITLADIQSATSLWIADQAGTRTELSRALRATLLTDSGVVRVLPDSQWRNYVGMRSTPNSYLGESLRHAANETLFAESQMHPIISAASETEREQLESIFNELHLLNRILDHSFTRSDLPANQILEVGRATRGQVFAFLNGVNHRLPSEVAGLAVAAVAAALPLPASVMIGAFATAAIARDMMTGDLRARILTFRDRITGPDSEDRARALREATVALAATLVGGTNASSIGEMIGRRVGGRMNIVESGAEMAVLRTTGQEIFNDVLRELHLPLRELPEAIFQVRIATPFGEAVQDVSREALLARSRAEAGARLYRVSTRLTNQTGGGAQFWALEHPNTPGFAQRHGLPQENVTDANFIETAFLRTEVPFVTRLAPGVSSNVGGAIEVVVLSNGVILESHTN